jgi:hypothetical protein
MTARKESTGGESGRSAEASGPESTGLWGWSGGIDRQPPWGVSEDSPLDEGSEQTAVSPDRRGERRAGPGEPRVEPSGRAGRHGFGSVEPTRVPEAGPGGPPDPAPSRRTFPDASPGNDVPDNPLERQTGMRPEGVSRRVSRRGDG